MKYPVTPDGRYFVVRGRLWRCSNQGLPPNRREELTGELMMGRRDKGHAMRSGDKVSLTIMPTGEDEEANEKEGSRALVDLTHHVERQEDGENVPESPGRSLLFEGNPAGVPVNDLLADP